TILRRLERERMDLRALVRAMPDPDAFLAAKRQRLDLAEARLAPALAANARDHRERLTRLSDRLARRSPAVALADARGRLARIGERPRTALRYAIERRRDRLEALGGLLGALSYRGVLARGYVLVRDEDGAPLRSATIAGMAARLHLQFADGAVVAIPESDTADGEGHAKRSARGGKTREPKRPAARQGSLF
ncbi:exodeoxyribonuclease VII large subunit, partial [Methylobacterium sp. WL9]